MRAGTGVFCVSGQATRQPTRLARWWLLALGLGLGLASMGTASAHTRLLASVPGDGQVVSAAPTELRLNFNEALEPRFSRVEISGADGQPVAAGPLRMTDDGQHSAIVPVTALPSGRYQVSWSAMGRDGHRMKGQFSFSVK
jgi:methionine-rich copper-binding protein CopC